jgi:predicted dehydrogenase
MSTGQELRIGVIGAGGRGSLARHAHKPEEDSRIVAGADIDPAALEKCKEWYGPDFFGTKDYCEVLARPDIDAVFVTSPDFLHEEHAVAALEAGKHVYLEKPMTITIEGCDRLLRTAYERQVKLYCGHNMRHMAFSRKMRELVQKGAIGQVKAAWCRHFVCYGGDAYFKDWHAEQRYATSLLLQKGAHDIDLLHWMCGGYSTRVTAMGNLTVYNQITDKRKPGDEPETGWRPENWPPLSQKGMNPIIDVEDLSMMLMNLDNGVLASYQQCHYTPDGWRNYTIIGTEGRIENFCDYHGHTVVRLWNRRTHYNPYGDEQYYVGSTSGGNHGGADENIVREFVRYCREGGKIATSPIAARNAVAAGCQAAQSLRNGSMPQDVPAVDPKIREYFDRDLEE